MRHNVDVIKGIVFLSGIFLLQLALEGHAQAASTQVAATATTASQPAMKDLMKTIVFPKFNPFSYPRKWKEKDYDDWVKIKPQPLLVPTDVRLLSLNKKVTASEEPSIGELEQVTDGDNDGCEGSYIDLPEGRQWIQVDLGEPYELYAIALWHTIFNRIYHDVVVQVSNDEQFSKSVTTVFNNDRDNSSKLGKGQDREYIEINLGRLIDCRRPHGKPVAARYIRVYGNGTSDNTTTQFTEVGVYGKEPK